MGKAQTVNTEHGEVTAKELTVGQVRDVLEHIGGTNPHIIDILFDDEGVPAIAVSLSTGLPLESDENESLLNYSAGDMRRVIKAVKEANPDFLALAQRMRGDRGLPEKTPERISTDS